MSTRLISSSTFLVRIAPEVSTFTSYNVLVSGSPSAEDFSTITSRRAREYVRSLPFRRRKDFRVLFPHASEDATDFLSKTLVCTPALQVRLKIESYRLFTDLPS